MFYLLYITYAFLFQDLQDCLTTRSNELNAVAFDIQVFISERAQDLAPEQSRRLLGQLQQLQSAFHQASGRTHTKAEALSVQRVREEEREQKEREREQEEREREKERQTAREREVCKYLLECLCLYSRNNGNMIFLWILINNTNMMMIICKTNLMLISLLGLLSLSNRNVEASLSVFQ